VFLSELETVSELQDGGVVVHVVLTLEHGQQLAQVEGGLLEEGFHLSQ
jgi:hypothetical protein